MIDFAYTAQPRKPGRLVAVTLELQGGKKLENCISLRIEQDLFCHHRFEIVVPFDELESSEGVFFNQAHQQVCGQVIKVSFAPKLEDGSFDFQFKGVITGITLKQRDLSSVYVLRGFSPTIVLEDTTRRQAYLEMGLSDIFNKVLGDYPSNVLKNNINPRSSDTITYTAQHDESNFDFLRRLAADNGEWFYYDGTQLCLGDPDDGESKDFQIDGIQSFVMSIDLKPSGFSIGAYDYTQDQVYESQSSSENVEGLNSFGSFAMDESQQLFTGKGFYVASRPVTSASEVSDQVKNRKGGIGAETVTFSGTGINPELTLATVIKVSGSLPKNGGRSDDDSFGEYRVTRIVHEVDERGNYSSSFSAIPKSMKLPPANPYVRRPSGNPELAIVTDNNDPDNLGRVKVKYMWSQDATDRDSAWVRVATFYAGGDDGMGALFIPEVNAQVLIAYEHGNPDTPYIIGSVYPKKSGTRSASSGNSRKIIYTKAGNIIDISDEDQDNKITITNTNAGGTFITLSFKDDGKIKLGTDGDIEITAQKDLNIKGNNVYIDADEKISLSAKDSLEMKGQTSAKLEGADVEVSADSSLSAKGGSQVQVSSNGALQMSGTQSELDGNAMLTLKGALVQIN